MPENQTYHFTMGSDLDPHVVANKAASIEKKGEVTAKQNQGFISRPVTGNRRAPVPVYRTGLTGYRSEPDKRKFEFKFPR